MSRILILSSALLRLSLCPGSEDNGKSIVNTLFCQHVTWAKKVLERLPG